MKSKRLSIAFLINPISGGGIGKSVFALLPEIMASFGFSAGDWSAELTDQDRLVEQTDAILKSAQKVIAVGGDGTIGFILSRLRVNPSVRAQIGLIPLGTGNDLGRTLGIYRIYSQKGLLACVKRLIKAPSTPFDLWDINGRLTLASYFSFGMDAAVLQDFDCARSQGRIPRGKCFNLLYYGKAFLVHARRGIGKPVDMIITGPGGKHKLRLHSEVCCLVGNINSYAAGSRPFAESSFSDGLLDVIVFDSLWKFLALIGLSRLLPGMARAFGKKLPRYVAAEIEVNGLQDVPVQIDGENVSRFCAENPTILIRRAGQVRLLDLRRVGFGLF